jgi:hypothetical protein
MDDSDPHKDDFGAPLSYLTALTELSIRTYCGIDQLLSKLNLAAALRRLNLLSHFGESALKVRDLNPTKDVILNLLQLAPELQVRVAHELTNLWPLRQAGIARLDVYKDKLIQPPEWFTNSQGT